jgi:predicted nucleotidyltransferase
MPVHAELSSFRSVLQSELPRLAADYGVASLALFGSYVRGEQRPDSDLDILVTFTKIPGLIRFVTLESELSDLLGVKVDLVLRDSLKPHIAKNVLESSIAV